MDKTLKLCQGTTKEKAWINRLKCLFNRGNSQNENSFDLNYENNI